MDQNQTTPTGAVSSSSTLFVKGASEDKADNFSCDKGD